MPRRFVPFQTWMLHQELHRIRREVARFETALRDLIDDVLPQQQARLRCLRDSGPWDAMHDEIRRAQTEQARAVIHRMRQHRELCDDVAELEARLPPRRGWHRLRYVDPWVITAVLGGGALLVNGYRLGAAFGS